MADMPADQQARYDVMVKETQRTARVVEQLSGELGEAQAEITRLRAKLDKAEAAISSLQAELPAQLGTDPE